MAVEKFEITEWDGIFPKKAQQKAILDLEDGKVLFFPHLQFALLPREDKFFSPDKVDPKRKNISYDLAKDLLGGTLCVGEEAQELKAMMRRYATRAKEFLERLFPQYIEWYVQGKTSFRPVEISGRKTSPLKDDTRLHVDAFPSNPLRGQRILRIFTNVNPEGKPRHWRIGEPFGEVVKKFSGSVSKPWPLLPPLLKFLGITKNIRTSYDHYMLHIHNKMKLDLSYQEAVRGQEMHFPSGSSWMAFTDQVSHAALAGQHILEQTFYIPVEGLKNPATSPLKSLERHLNRSLV